MLAQQLRRKQLLAGTKEPPEYVASIDARVASLGQNSSREKHMDYILKQRAP